MVFVESPANPTKLFGRLRSAKPRTGQLLKLKQCHRPISVCDNTLMGPVYPTSRANMDRMAM